MSSSAAGGDTPAMKHTILISILFAALLLSPGCSALAKYERPSPGPFGASASSVEAIAYCLYLKDPDPLCSVTQAMVAPPLLPVWIGNLGVALPFDLLTLPYDLLASEPETETEACEDGRVRE